MAHREVGNYYGDEPGPSQRRDVSPARAAKDKHISTWGNRDLALSSSNPEAIGPRDAREREMVDSLVLHLKKREWNEVESRMYAALRENSQHLREAISSAFIQTADRVDDLIQGDEEERMSAEDDITQTIRKCFSKKSLERIYYTTNLEIKLGEITKSREKVERLLGEPQYKDHTILKAIQALHNAYHECERAINEFNEFINSMLILQEEKTNKINTVKSNNGYKHKAQRGR